MDDIEENVHVLDGATISLYQNDPENNWSMAYPSHGSMARSGLYDSFSDDSSRSQNSDRLYEERKNEATGLLTTTTTTTATTTKKMFTENNKLNMDELPDTRYGERFMGKYSNYNQKLGNAHVWVIVFVKSLDHIGRKFFEYFAYFLAFDYFNFSSFYMFSWCVAAIDFSAILSMFILPFIIDKSPKKLQVICQSLIGKSIIAMAFWKGFGGLFILRFIFGLAYSLLLSIWSCCVAAFIPHAKQARAASKIELSWAIASFSFILVAWILEHNGVNLILYILGILGVVCACVLGGIMPNTRLIYSDNGIVEYDKEHCFEMIRSMFMDILFYDFASIIFLFMIGLITFTNMMITICLAPWFIQDYELTLTEFGYTTVILGTAQLTSIVFSGQFRKKLGTGWSMVAGTLVQFIMFILLLLFNNHGIIVNQFYVSEGGQGHYTFPLLIILLFLCIHYIAAEFTFINASTAMMQIAPSKTTQTVASNCLRLFTSGARICGAIIGVLIWEYGQFKSIVLVGCTCLAISLILGVILMSCILKESSVFTEIHLRNSNGNNNNDMDSDSSIIDSDNDEDGYDSVTSNERRKERASFYDHFDLTEINLKRRRIRNKNNKHSIRMNSNNLLNNDNNSETESSEFGDIDESDDDESQRSFVNERLDVEAILSDIDNYQHNAAHVNNLRVL